MHALRMIYIIKTTLTTTTQTYYRQLRYWSTCFFTPDVSLLTPVALSLGPNDIVVHLRVESVELDIQNEVPMEYYVSILQQRQESNTLGQVWIATEPSLRSHPIALTLVNIFQAKFHEGTSLQDHYLLRVAPTLICSSGTFSWTAVYLSTGNKVIHIPFFSSLYEASDWFPLNALFIDDDDRIFYHDCSDVNTVYRPLSAEMVLGQVSTLFVKGIRNRFSNSQCGIRELSFSNSNSDSCKESSFHLPSWMQVYSFSLRYSIWFYSLGLTIVFTTGCCMLYSERDLRLLSLTSTLLS